MTIDMITGTATFLIGIAYTFSAVALPRATVGKPMGHIIFPVILGGLLVGFGLLLLLRELVKQKKLQATQGYSETLGSVDRGQQGSANKSGKHTYTRMIGISTGAGVLYALLFYPIGYVLSTFIFLEIITTTLNGSKHWKMNTVISIVFSVAVYLLFSNFLGITLPRMPILDI